MSTPEIVDHAHDLILTKMMNNNQIVKALDKSRGQCVGFIIDEHLDMQNLSAKWVLKCLNADQKLY